MKGEREGKKGTQNLGWVGQILYEVLSSVLLPGEGNMRKRGERGGEKRGSTG
jgi:hypothetical protein